MTTTRRVNKIRERSSGILRLLVKAEIIGGEGRNVWKTKR
jgi:hypothetical protein